jgi:hypothetical protein
MAALAIIRRKTRSVPEKRPPQRQKAPGAPPVERRQILAFRRRRQHLQRPFDGGAGAVTDVVGACPMQNTPPGTAALALRARVAALTPAALDEGLAAKTLVQAWSLRGAPHVLPAGDLGLFTVALAPADEDEARYLLRPILDDLDGMGLGAQAAIERTAAAIGAALDGGPRSKDDLLDELTRRLPPGLNPWCPRCRIHHAHPALQRAAALEGGFLLAPRRGNEAHLVRTDRWLGAAPAPGGDTGHELVRRYLRAYGPSTAAAFATWAGIAPRAGRRLWQPVAAETVAVSAGGERAWVLAADAAALEAAGGGKGAAPEGVRLLPPNDPYLTQVDRETPVPDRARRGEIWRAAGAPGVLLVDGEVAGTWRSRKAGRRLEVAVRPFAPLPASARSRTAALADDLAGFRGCETAALTWTEGAA